MNKYNGFVNKDTWNVIELIMGDDDELTFFCTNSEIECTNKLNEDYFQKYPLISHLEILRYFKNMKNWQEYLTTTRREYLSRRLDW